MMLQHYNKPFFFFVILLLVFHTTTFYSGSKINNYNVSECQKKIYI